MAKKISPRAAASLRTLGHAVQLARRRRRIRQRDLAARMGVCVSTLRALESGDPGVSLGAFAMALLALGMLPRLEGLADLAEDDIGLLMDIESLPRRVRLRGRRPSPRVDGGEAPALPRGAVL